MEDGPRGVFPGAPSDVAQKEQEKEKAKSFLANLGYVFFSSSYVRLLG
jgi:hypothetical protein